MVLVRMYFVFWHSLQHVLRLSPRLDCAAPAEGRRLPARELLRQLAFFSRRAALLLLG